MNPEASVALVVTVLNEAATIDSLLESIAAQQRPPDRVTIVDGGSADGTWERLLAWQGRLPLRLERLAGASISRGRNAAIEASPAEWIAVTDAGVRLEPDWLRCLLDAASDGVDVVSGFFAPDARSDFERAMGATVLPEVGDVDPESFLPSSRSVLFRREAWKEVGGYPEWLDYCEDLVFDFALRAAGRRFIFAPRALAWFRPRGSFRTFFRQYYLYARGDGKADLWRKRHAIRYATYLAAGGLAWLGRSARWPWLLLATGGLAYTWRPYQRLLAHRDSAGRANLAKSAGYVPLIRVVGDVAKMLGYPVGLAWRWRSGDAIISGMRVDR